MATIEEELAKLTDSTTEYLKKASAAYDTLEEAAVTRANLYTDQSIAGLSTLYAKKTDVSGFTLQSQPVTSAFFPSTITAISGTLETRVHTLTKRCEFRFNCSYSPQFGSATELHYLFILPDDFTQPAADALSIVTLEVSTSKSLLKTTFEVFAVGSSAAMNISTDTAASEIGKTAFTSSTCLIGKIKSGAAANKWGILFALQSPGFITKPDGTGGSSYIPNRLSGSWYWYKS